MTSPMASSEIPHYSASYPYVIMGLRGARVGARVTAKARVTRQLAQTQCVSVRDPSVPWRHHWISYVSSYTPVARSITSAGSPLTSSCLVIACSMTSSQHLLITSSSIFICRVSLRHIYFYHTYSPSAESAYVTSYLFLRDYVVISNSIKRQHRTHFTHSSAGQRQRHYYLLASNNMDELNNLRRIEELCHNLRRQQEQQSSPTITPTG